MVKIKTRQTDAMTDHLTSNADHVTSLLHMSIVHHTGDNYKNLKQIQLLCNGKSEIVWTCQ